MSTAAELEAELVAINSTTDEIAADIADLQSQIAGGLSAAEATTVGNALNALKVKLTAVAAAHTTDSPGTPPTPPAPPSPPVPPPELRR